VVNRETSASDMTPFPSTSRAVKSSFKVRVRVSVRF